MFEYLLFCVLVGNVVATSLLWLHHHALKKVAIKTIDDKRMELLEHREKMRGDVLEICESMWTSPQEWILTANGALHRSGLTIATLGSDSVYVKSPLPDQNLNLHEQREVLQALRHVQATQMRAFLANELDSPHLPPSLFRELNDMTEPAKAPKVTPLEALPVRA